MVCTFERIFLCSVFRKFCEKKSEAMEYEKMLNGLPHKVEQIEKRRKVNV